MQQLGHGNPFHEAPSAVFLLILMSVDVWNSSPMESAVGDGDWCW